MTKPKRVALYLRVSSDESTIENQRRDLLKVAENHGWLIDEKHIFIDEGISGAKRRDERPGFDALCNGIARKEFDMVASWAVDRLGRSLQDLVGFLDELNAKKIDLFLHQQNLDTSTPSGRAMFQLLGVFAEFERAMITSRIKSGLARARATGKTKDGRTLVLGKPSNMTDKDRAEAREMLKQGVGVLKVAKTFKAGTKTIQKMKAELKAAA